MSILDIWPLIVGFVSDARGLNWDELVYRRESQVIKATAFFAGVFFIALVIKWRRKKSTSHYYTGLVINKRHGPGMVFRSLRGFAFGMVIISLCFLGIALADPVIIVTNITKQIESREIIYIKDVSASNGFHLPNSKITRGELANETLKKLILKRKEKMDRAAYIVFGTYSEVWSGFTTSYDSLTFSISMSPIALAPANAQKMWPGMFIMKKGQYVESAIGGSTNLHLGLESAIYLFDRNGSPKITEELKVNPSIKMRSVIIITDGSADIDPEPQFLELQKRRIIPYLIFVDPDRTIESTLYGPNSPKAKPPSQILMMVRRGGGQYFLANDRQSTDRISEQIDKLQSIKQTKIVNIKEDEVYFIPLAISFIFAASAMTVRFLFLFVWRIV